MRENFVLIIIFIVLSSVSVSHSQADTYRPPPEDCEKYCFAKCDKYINETVQRASHNPPIGIWLSAMVFYYQARNSNEFTDCVTAKSYCQCDSQFNIKNPLLWLALAAAGISLLIFIYYLCRNYLVYHAGRILFGTSTVASPVTSPTVNTISSNNNTPFTDWYRGSDYDDTPPTYEPPPAYCDISEKTSNESEVNNCDTKSDKTVPNYMTFK